MQQSMGLGPQPERGLGHLAIWGPGCGVGPGDRPLLCPHNLHNELRACLSFNFPGNAGVVTAPLSSLHPHLACGVFFFFLWWYFREHEEGSCHALRGALCGGGVFEVKEQLPSLTKCARGRKGRQAVGPQGPCGVPHCTIHLLFLIS